MAGNAFVAPAAWTLRVRGAGTILEAPEGGSFVAIYDLAEAKDADDAVAQAWAAYQGKAPYPLITSVAAADDDGWRKIRRYRTLIARDGQHEYVTPCASWRRPKPPSAENSVEHRRRATARTAANHAGGGPRPHHAARLSR